MTSLRLILLLQVALAGLAAAELETYQEVDPLQEQREKLERLLHFLQEAQHQKHQQIVNERQLELKHLWEQEQPQEQRGLFREDLPERPNILDFLQGRRINPFEYAEELEQDQKQSLLPYLQFQPEPRPKPFSFEDELRSRIMPAPVPKDPMLDYPEPQYVDLERARELENVAVQRAQQAHRHRPEFTYAFDPPEPAVEGAPPPFAVRPNDPRYFEEDKGLDMQEIPNSAEVWDDDKSQTSNKNQELISTYTFATTTTTEKPAATVKQKPRKPSAHHLESSMVSGERVPETSLIQANMLPEPRRRAEMDPVVVSLGRKANDDIYFIATVAGLSAVAMFALVMISLTWCRIQKVSKAAADVEYPAYGVTGPNKDMSPSGDQRLAQSAQMYHFQHQKQQIIAMEKASAAREPGSVSEAESDEENEEGDYTVYECPGLAPTGEMEVKNPLFHDDPTPATPKSKNDDD